jgi:hypothetical protein
MYYVWPESRQNTGQSSESRQVEKFFAEHMYCKPFLPKDFADWPVAKTGHLYLATLAAGLTCQIEHDKLGAAQC